MAIVYFVKDGPRPSNSGPGYEANILDLETCLAGRQLKYLGTLPPEFNVGNPSLYPMHVVIEVEPSESLGRMLSQTGFFLIDGAMPSEIGSVLFPEGHPSPRT